MGLIIVGIGLAIALFDKLPWVGKLPGDLSIRKGNFTFYFPLATCLLVSILLTLIFNLFGKK